MNPNHDDRGQFAEGPGGALGSRMNRFVTNNNPATRHDWMGHSNARPEPGRLSQHDAHARQDQVAKTAAEHRQVPAFGKRGR